MPGVTGPSGLLAAVAGFKRIGVTFQTELPKVERPWGLAVCFFQKDFLGD